MNASIVNELKTILQGSMRMSHPEAGPNGAFLVCNKHHSFTDADGTYSVQHRCGGTTGPWGYQISTAVCATAISLVNET